MGLTLLRSHQREFLLEYGRALKNTPQIFRRIAFRRRTLEEELAEVREASMPCGPVVVALPCRLWGLAQEPGQASAHPASFLSDGNSSEQRMMLSSAACHAAQALLRGSLRKAFNSFDLLCLGLGIVIGTGWGLLSGVAAETYAGRVRQFSGQMPRHAACLSLHSCCWCCALSRLVSLTMHQRTRAVM